LDCTRSTRVIHIKRKIDMNIKQQITKQISESITVKQTIMRDDEMLIQIEKLANVCYKSMKLGGKIIFAGNGGSFADAQHLSAEFTSRFLFDRAPLPSIALATNSSAMSAISNDYGYQFVFARELEAIASSQDVFIPISTSGNSANIIEAILVAKDKDIPTVALVGGNGGRIKDMCECILIPSNDTARIQESHIMLGHIICGLVESRYFGE
jgi:D-sedoheptulose 7-phosphate isomerase